MKTADRLIIRPSVTTTILVLFRYNFFFKNISDMVRYGKIDKHLFKQNQENCTSPKAVKH